MNRRIRLLIALVLLASVAATVPGKAAQIANDAFVRTWERTDRPITAGQVSRTWMWGPEPFTDALQEPYAEAPGGQRLVQYFDKTRMELTDPNADPASIWYVTNGLLATELITGQLQVGDNTFEKRQPAQVNVAGDATDPNGPTYRTFSRLLNTSPQPHGSTITQTVDRAGNVGTDDALGQYGVTAAEVGAPTNHTVASVFWTFMNSSGVVYQGGQYVTDHLFPNPFYASGYPLTEAYWTAVRVEGQPKQVLVQVFERRVLTYTPDNPEGWRVEAGNVGQHYYQWRYGPGGRKAEAQVDIADFFFEPATITVSRGSTVTWTNVGPTAHTATSVDGVWDSGILNRGESFSFTFNNPGRYDYRCTLHPTMGGTVVVE